jgi:hypothetical protein
MEQSTSWEANQWALQLVKKFPAFMKTESPSPYPQLPATCPYPEQIPSSLHDLLQLPDDPINIILSSTSWSPERPCRRSGSPNIKQAMMLTLI